MNPSDPQTDNIGASALEAMPPEPTSLWSRLFNVLAAPGEVFDEVKARPACTANWLVPMLLCAVVSAVAMWVVYSQPALQQQQDEASAQFIQRLVEKGKIPPEQAAAMQNAAQPQSTLKYTLGPTAGAAVVALASPFWGALLIWIIGSKVLKGGFSYLKAVEVAGLACMVDVVGVVVRALLMLTLVSLYASASPALFLKGFDWLNPAHMALAMVDLFALWLCVVRAVGMARLGGLRLGVCLAWMLGLWVLLSAFMVGLVVGARALFGL